MERDVGALARRIIGSVTDPVMRVKAVHDWVILNTAYDLAVLDDLRHAPSIVFHATGVLERGLAVCSGYAEATKLLLAAVGIETLVVTNEDHAWNMVRIGGTWYHLDVTGDDPVPDVPGRVVYTYFLVSSGTLAAYRRINAEPVAPSDWLAGVHSWNGRPVVHRYDEVLPAVSRLLSAGCPVCVYLWRLDPDRAFEELHRSLPAEQRVRVVRARWCGKPHLQELRLAADEAGLDREAGGGGRAPFRRPWFRLYSPDHRDCLTIRADPLARTQVLDRRTARTVFPSVVDDRGNPLYRYFEPDVPMLEFALKDTGWHIRVPEGCRNAFVLAGARLDASWKPVFPGDRLTLHSSRRGRTIESLSLVVEGPASP